MGLKRKLWLIYVNTCIRCMRRKRLEQTDHLNCDTTPQKTGHIDLVTVAFNNEHLIKQQLLLLKKFIQDKPVHFTIADNSNIPGKRKIIKNICRELGAGYISMPQNMLQHYPGGSYAHGSSLNWIYTNYIKLRRPTFFGFLDHDLFPIKTISISQLIGGQDFYGAINQRPKGWYLWAGLSIFRFKAVENLPLNFIPYIEQGEWRRKLSYSLQKIRYRQTASYRAEKYSLRRRHRLSFRLHPISGFRMAAYYQRLQLERL